MESYIPTRPTSDLHSRFSARKRPPAAIHTQNHMPVEVDGRTRQRSSSFSAIGQTLSRLLPSNRKEKGGTLRCHEDDSNVVDDPDSLNFVEEIRKRGRPTKIEDERERRTKSWSPKKLGSAVDEKNDGESIRLGKFNKPRALKRLWELHKTVKLDNKADSLSQYPDGLLSEPRELPRAQDIMRANDVAEQENLERQYSPINLDNQEVDSALKRSRQIFEEKRARREERRSFRESDDFLGVQGANPRTGYPDTSTATSSSAGDIMSEVVRQKLEEDEKRMQSASKEYREALERRETELRRLEAEKERRRREKKERAERKRVELRARMRKGGRWRSEDQRWSMVTEPELSPILQSTVGSPTRETVPANSAPVRSLATNEDSIPDLSANVEEDYFNRAASPLKPPRTLQRYTKPYVDKAPDTPQRLEDPVKFVENASKSPPQNHLPIDSESASGNHPRGHTQALQQFSIIPIRRKEVGSPIIRRRASSSETVIHKIEAGEPMAAELEDNPCLEVATTPLVATPRLRVMTPGETMHNIPLKPSAPYDQHFLDLLTPSELGGLQENRATATSYQSASMNQAPFPLQLLQNPTDILRANRILSLEEFPPVVLKDPISASILSTAQHQEIQIPPLNPTKEPSSHGSNIITHIITTTGSVGPRCPLGQFDGSKDFNEAQVSPQRLMPANSRIPTPNFRLKVMPNGTPNAGSQMDQADIATSSAHHLPAFVTPTKRPIQRPCQPTSVKLEGIGAKRIRTSIFTSPQWQSPSQQHVVAQRAARAAFSKVKARSMSLISPKTRAKEIGECLGQGRKTFSVGNVDTGDLFRTREELERNPHLLKKRIESAKNLGGPPSNDGKDSFITWCSEVADTVRIADENASPERKKATHRSPKNTIKGTQSSPNKKSRKSGKSLANTSLLRNTYEVVKQAIRTAWWFVSPVFNPRSGLRWRWERHELTWQDVLLIGAAGIFGGGAFVIMVLCARLLGVGVQIVKVSIKVCKMLTGL